MLALLARNDHPCHLSSMSPVINQRNTAASRLTRKDCCLLEAYDVAGFLKKMDLWIGLPRNTLFGNPEVDCARTCYHVPAMQN